MQSYSNIGVYEYDEKTKKHKYYVKAPKIKNIVISGGGAKGVILPGVIKAFEKYHPDGLEHSSFMQAIKCVVGSSIGAVTAGLLASGITSTELTDAANKAGGKGLLGKGTIEHDGIPLLNFVRDNMWKSISSRLMENFSHSSENVIDALIELGKQNNLDPQIFAPIRTYLLIGEMGPISFEMMHHLHEFLPQYFKSIIVTGTNKEDGTTVYFSFVNTPHLDIIKACRASAALPILIAPMDIPVDELRGGQYEIDNAPLPNKESIAFIDGGYLDNIPVSSVKKTNTTDTNRSDLETVALVFDEFSPVLGQSPLLNVRNAGPVYTPNTKDKIARDWLVGKMTGLEEKNTKKKQEGFEKIREDYAQRHIPLGVDLTTTDFDIATANSAKYQKLGEELATEYLQNHHAELISYYEADDIASLQAMIEPPELKKDLTMILVNTQIKNNVSSSANSSNRSNSSITTKTTTNTTTTTTTSDLSSDFAELTKHILNYLEKITVGHKIDKSDHLSRTQKQVLRQNLLDNLENNLNNQQKKLNILKILFTHFYSTNEHDDVSYLKKIIETEFKNEITTHGLSITSSNNTVEKLKNNDALLKKMYPEKFQKINTSKIFNDFVASLKEIIDLKHGNGDLFWVGKGKEESKIGRKNKIPEIIQQASKILSSSNKLTPEDMYYQIQALVENIGDKTNLSVETKKLIVVISNCKNFENFSKGNLLDEFKADITKSSAPIVASNSQTLYGNKKDYAKEKEEIEALFKKNITTTTSTNPRNTKS